MSRTFHHGERRIRVRGEPKDPDLRRLARIFIDLAVAQAEADAERDHGRTRPRGAQAASRSRRRVPGQGVVGPPEGDAA